MDRQKIVILPNTKLKAPARSPGPPKTREFSVTSRGPLYLPRSARQGGGPGEPPPGFVTPTTSAVEWLAYWAMWKIFGLPQNPRSYPYLGGMPYWGYQVGIDGGREAGGAVVDFMMMGVVNSARRLGIRIVTEYWHLSLGSAKQAFDQAQMANLNRYIDVIDVLDRHLGPVANNDGRMPIIAMKRGLGLIRTSDPLMTGLTQRAA